VYQYRTVPVQRKVEMPPLLTPLTRNRPRAPSYAPVPRFTVRDPTDLTLPSGWRVRLDRPVPLSVPLFV